jgi:hypothetical protein
MGEGNNIPYSDPAETFPISLLPDLRPGIGAQGLEERD